MTASASSGRRPRPTETPPLEVSIRLEIAGDEPGVRAVELAAFSGPEEADIVDRIRDDAPDGWRSLVADGRAAAASSATC